MKYLSTVLVLLLLPFCVYGSQKPALQGQVTVIMFDVSRSMTGYGDGRGIDILDQVKQTVKRDVLAGLQPGDMILFYPFSTGVVKSSALKLAIRDDNDIRLTNVLIDNLNAAGPSTHLQKSILDGLQQVSTLTDEYTINKTTLVRFLVFTDGIGNGPGDTGASAFSDFIDTYKLMQDKYAHLFSKFIILDAQNFNQDVVEKLQKAGVEVESFDRQVVRDGKLHVDVNPPAPEPEQPPVVEPEQQAKPVKKANPVVTQPARAAKIIRVVDKPYLIEQEGTITVLLAQDLLDLVETEISVVNDNQVLPYTVKEPVVIVTGNSIEVELKPQDSKRLDALREQLKSNRIIRFKLVISSRDPDYQYKPQEIEIKSMIKAGGSSFKFRFPWE